MMQVTSSAQAVRLLRDISLAATTLANLHQQVIQVGLFVDDMPSDFSKACFAILADLKAVQEFFDSKIK